MYWSLIKCMIFVWSVCLTGSCCVARCSIGVVHPDCLLASRATWHCVTYSVGLSAFVLQMMTRKQMESSFLPRMVWIYPSGSAACQAVNCHQLCLPGCCRMYMEQPAIGYHVCWVVVHIPPATEDPSVIKVISQIFSGSLTAIPGH